MQANNPDKSDLKIFALLLCVLLVSIFQSACAEIQKPEPEPFYAQTTPPPKQEFRWSNGKPPRSFDPARAAAAPETDIVRALFEGLTDLDARSLKEVPAIAEKWTSSPDFRIWTFHLRNDARWSNGKRVTANNFVTSWKRLRTLGDRVAHPELFQNIVGLQNANTRPLFSPGAAGESPARLFGENLDHKEQPNSAPNPTTSGSILRSASEYSISAPKNENKILSDPNSVPERFGVEAVDENTLKVTLKFPDKDFPKLVAHPIFRPIYGDGSGFETAPLDADVITNGAFAVASVGKDGIILDRSDVYWKRPSVSLERVKFVFKESAEAALTAYKKGEIDALTNAEFEPLALKILAPYDDFRQTTHSALNFYEFNTKNAPFDDLRIREALVISIDRERLTDDELERTAKPAHSFLPLGDKKSLQLSYDVQRAKQLLVDAGYAAGVNFPRIKLLVNRNDTQQRVARAVAKMWKQNLNLDTDIIVRELSEIDTARALGEYDLVRRGVVLPTMDEFVGIAAIFDSPKNAAVSLNPLKIGENGDDKDAATLGSVQSEDNLSGQFSERHSEVFQEKNIVETEEEALSELTAIPLYFPMAYSLVKPYVRGFEVNGLDTMALESISIDSSWQPKAGKIGY